MVNTQMVEFRANGGTAPGYLARPEGDAPALAVVVIQEWWGLDAHIKSIAERFADEGFVALAPDLYRGRVTDEPDEARKLAMELDYPQAIKDIQGAVNYLRDQPFVEPKQIGVIGFCMGGGLAGQMALRGDHVGAAITFYGIRNPIPEALAQEMKAPILGIYGELDEGFPLEVVQGNDAVLKAAGKIVETIIYPDARHAFFNDSRPGNYHAEASQAAWEASIAWLKKYLV